MSLDPTATWMLRTRALPLDRPVVMGIVNVTPDSFSDGGAWFDADRAVAHALAMLDEGAEIIDIGGESTRPGMSRVSIDDELARVVPVIERVIAERSDVVISIDTVKSEVARVAIERGAEIVNDVSAMRADDAMASVCASAECGVVLMHSRGRVDEMASYTHANYEDVVDAVRTELNERLQAARRAGISAARIALDPGIGFSKRGEHSVAMLANVGSIVSLGRPVVVGASRKRFIGELSGVTTAAERVFGTVAAHVMALAGGARIFRVHDVRAARQSLDVAWAIMNAAMEHAR